MQEPAEQTSFAAQVQKEVIEAWADADYAEMEVDRATADTELGFTMTILPRKILCHAGQRGQGNGRTCRRGMRGGVPGGNPAEAPCSRGRRPYRVPG